jgi:hypothetical protein
MTDSATLEFIMKRNADGRLKKMPKRIPAQGTASQAKLLGMLVAVK